MNEAEKKDLKEFHEYLVDWWKGNLDTLESDPHYKNFMEKVKAKDPETLFARNMGGAYAVQLVQKEYDEKIYSKYSNQNF